MRTLDSMSIDITHQILLQVADRRDLFSLINSSHQYYDIFKLHPNSILRRVVCNETGILEEVLPYAWNALKLVAKDFGMPLIREDSLTVSMHYTCVKLLKYAQSTVQGMAKLFSVRCKDSLTIQDTLTYEETRRVHTAAYIYWQYHAFWQVLFQSKVEDHLNSSDDNDGDNQGTRGLTGQELIWQCTSFLLDFSTRDLLWLDVFVRQFLVQDVEICIGPRSAGVIEDAQNELIQEGWDYELNEEQWIYYALSRGPAFFGTWTGTFHRATAFALPVYSQHTWLKDVLLDLIQQRCVDQEAKTSPENRLVLKVNTLTQTCQRCRVGPSQDHPLFYNVTNLADVCNKWHVTFLPGYLGSNPVEMSRLHQRLYGMGQWEFMARSLSMDQSFPVEVMTDVANKATDRAINSLSNFTSRGSELELSDDEDGAASGEKNPPTPKVYEWSPLDPLCFDCFRSIFVEFYYAWWVEERNSDRVEAHNFIEDCWWGWECRTQRRQEHAAKLNHCCPRTREPRGVTS